MFAVVLLAAWGIVAAGGPSGQANSQTDQMELLKTFRSEFIAITPGEGMYTASMTMGRSEGGPDSARPTHEVTFQYPFEIAKYEVPQNLWQAVMGNNPSRWKGARNSVEMLSYDEAVAFCDKVTKLMQKAALIKPNQVVRLPSEAEWEYVARAGTKTVYSFGDEAVRLGEFGWFMGNAAGNDPPVGAKKPNPWGVCDIHGYLWEWCSDKWRDDYKGAPTDGSPAAEGDDTRRVLRGGSWKDKAELLTCSYRRAAPRTLKDDAIGLRCVLAAKKP